MAKELQILPSPKDCNIVLIRKTAPFMVWLLFAASLLLFFLSSILSDLKSTKLTSDQQIIFKPSLPHDHNQANPPGKNEDQDVGSKNNKDGDLQECDLFEGQWVRDYQGTAYTNTTCQTMPESKNCWRYGKNHDYVNWRWRPSRCELPAFDGATFLEVVRGKKMAFVGDSVARNQMESLLCLLSQVETPVDLEKDSEDRFRKWYFQSYNFTYMVWWTKFLVEAPEIMNNGSATGIFDLHLDKADTNWTSKLPGVDYVIISDGHWFFRKLYLHEKGHVIGCVFCSEPNVTDLGISFAVRRAFRTALEHVSGCKECQEGMFTMIRTFTPAHFENGIWSNGGYCNRTKPLNKEDLKLEGFEWEMRVAQIEELERARAGEREGSKRFGILDVTKAMMMRPDAHPNSHFNNDWNRGYNDCVHWCLPGPIDMWSDILLLILKRGW